MYRSILEDLKNWKESENRKPLVLQGARQVGKTWILKEFGSTYFKKTYYVQFMDNSIMNSLFSGDLNPEKIITGLEMYFGSPITAEDSLLIFDEIQENPMAVKSLKYFAEDAKEYYIVSAGSNLGMSLHAGISFPVGKVDFLAMYPLSFKEFLIASGEESFAAVIDYDVKSLNPFKTKLEILLKQYFFVGGMPEAVQTFIDTKDFSKVRKIQEDILKGYAFDFSKYADPNTSKLMAQVWKILPGELAKENKKFILSHVRSGLRAYQLEDALSWLSDAGLIHKVCRVKIPHLPLDAYKEESVFKLFMLDIGLLCAASNISSQLLVDGSKVFTEFKGALSEQYVLQELIANQYFRLFYYTNDNSTLEIDFLLDDGKAITPIEVEAGENVKAQSLKSYEQKYNPEKNIVASLREYEQSGNRIYLPLWAISSLSRILP